MSVDPAADEYPDLSPYTYVANNPVNLVDPDGKRIKLLNSVRKTMRNLMMIAATLKGRSRVNYLIGRGDTYTIQSVFRTKDSSYDHLGIKGDRYTIRYASNPWRIRVGNGGVTGRVIMGHEIDHAFFRTKGSQYYGTVSFLEEKGVRFANYLRSVFDDGPMRTRYPKYGIHLLSDESIYNPNGERITNFTPLDDFSSNGSTYLGYSYDHFDGISTSNHYILGSTDQDGYFNYETFSTFGDYNNAVYDAKGIDPNETMYKLNVTDGSN